MLVLGLGGAVIAINSGDLSLSISGMSLASVVGILLNIFLKGEEKEEKVARIIREDVGQVKQDMRKLKQDIKNELTVELKEDILNAIKEEMNKPTKKNKK